jgi:hypothetical protein
VTIGVSRGEILVVLRLGGASLRIFALLRSADRGLRGESAVGFTIDYCLLMIDLEGAERII